LTSANAPTGARKPVPSQVFNFRNATKQQSGVLSNRPWSHLSDHAPLAAEVVL